MKNHFPMQPAAYGLSLTAFTQNAGNGTATPQSWLHMADSSVVFTATDAVPAKFFPCNFCNAKKLV